MKTFKEYLEEISKKTYAAALNRKKHGDYYDDKADHETDKILKRAEREHGKKFANQVKDVGDKPRTRGLVKGDDPLRYRTPSKITKAGKIDKRDARDLKKTMKGENPNKPDLKGERDKRNAQRQADFKKELNQRIAAGLPTTGNWVAKHNR